MATLNAPIHSWGGRKARRNVIRAGRLFLMWPLVILVIAMYEFDRIFDRASVFAYFGVALVLALLAFNLFMVGLFLWMHCRWLEFDGVCLRGRRMWPFGEFEYPLESIREIAAATHHYGKQPESHMIRVGKRLGVTLYRDMTNSEELLSALEAAIAKRGSTVANGAATSTPA